MGTVVEILVLCTRGKTVTCSTATLLAASLYLLSPRSAREPAQLFAGGDQEEKQSGVVWQLDDETHLYLTQPRVKTMTGVCQKANQMSVVQKFDDNVTKPASEILSICIALPFCFPPSQPKLILRTELFCTSVCPIDQEFGFHGLHWNCFETSCNYIFKILLPRHASRTNFYGRLT